MRNIQYKFDAMQEQMSFHIRVSDGRREPLNMFTQMSGEIYKGTRNSMHTGMSCFLGIIFRLRKSQSFIVQNKLKHTSHKDLKDSRDFCSSGE